MSEIRSKAYLVITGPHAVVCHNVLGANHDIVPCLDCFSFGEAYVVLLYTWATTQLTTNTSIKSLLLTFLGIAPNQPIHILLRPLPRKL